MAKESIYGIGKDPIFRETFNSSQDVARNGGISYNMNYAGGRGLFDGTGYIDYFNFKARNHSNTHGYSIRIRFKVNAHVDNAGIFCNREAYLNGLILTNVSGEIQMRVQNSSVTINYTIGKWVEIVGEFNAGIITIYKDGGNKVSSANIGSVAINIVDAWRMGYDDSSATRKLKGEIELCEVYDYPLSDGEVANLYRNSRYRELPEAPIFHMTAETGVIEEKTGKTFTNTNVKVVKEGSIYAADFNGTNSVLTFGNILQFTNADSFTCILWFKTKTILTERMGFLGNAQFAAGGWMMGYLFTSLAYFLFTNDTVGSSIRLTDAVDTKTDWTCLVARFGSGTSSMAINGKIIASGVATITASASVFYIGYGSQPGYTVYFPGRIADVKVYGHKFSDEEILQNYNSTKFKYRG